MAKKESHAVDPVRQDTEAKLKVEKRSTVTNKDVFSMATYWCQKRIIVPTCILL